MHRFVAAVALAALALAVTTTASAQDGFTLRIAPRIGHLTPADWFYDEFPHFGVGDTEWTEAAILPSTLAGVTAELRLEGVGLWVRGDVLRTIGGETSLVHAVLVPPGGYNPPYVARSPYRLETGITFASLELVFPTRLRLPLGIQPYVAAGVGGKRYDFDTAPLADLAGRLVLPSDGTTLSANVAAGFTLDLSGFVLDLLVRDAISEYWGDTQHDVMVLAGVSLRLFRRGDP